MKRSRSGMSRGGTVAFQRKKARNSGIPPHPSRTETDVVSGE